MESDQNRSTNTEIEETKIKQEILAELDSFLLDGEQESQITKPEIDVARTKALQELDRLIKQDLSASEILTRLKSRTEQKPTEELPKMSNFYSSIHVVDLRHDYQEVAKNKPSFFVQLLDKNHKKKEKDLHHEEVLVEPVEKTIDPIPSDSLPQVEPVQEIAEPEEVVSPAYNYRLAFRNTAVTALIALVVLLPIQGIIFAGKFQSDKDKLLNYGQSGFLSFKSGVIKASSNSYQAADVDFTNALVDFDNAKKILNKYDASFLSIGDKLPVIGNTLKSGENILSISTSLSEAAKIINQKREQSINMTDYIVILNQQLDALLPLLEDTNRRLDKIVGVSDSLRLELDNFKKDLEPLLANLHQLKTITTTLEDLLGSNQEQRYLLLFQNNNELRPTGGFIGSYALIDVNKGQIVSMEIPKGGTYDLTAGQKKSWRSPSALAIVNLTFNIWDANWWPDFPSSAKKIAKLFAESSGSSVDGVIAINATVLQKLLAITGPLYLENYNVEINSQNVIDVLQNEIEGKRNEANPKTIISDLAPQILEKIFNTTDKTEDMFSLLAQILQNKDLQIYSTDQSIDKKISALGWRGEMMDTDRDYLWVVGSNIAGGKTDLYVNQFVEHQAQIAENGEIVDTVKITRSNDGDINNPLAGLDGANVSYLRFFVPNGSQLISASGFDTIPEQYFPDNTSYDIDPDLLKEESKLIDKDSKTEIFSSLNRTVFANWQMLKPGETKTVTITYKLPFVLDLGNGLINDWKKLFLASSRHFDHYSLLVQSQSGQSKTIFDSSIVFPSNSKIIWETANNENSVQVQNNEVHFNQNLDHDQYFGVVTTNQ